MTWDVTTWNISVSRWHHYEWAAAAAATMIMMRMMMTASVCVANVCRCVLISSARTSHVYTLILSLLLWHSCSYHITTSVGSSTCRNDKRQMTRFHLRHIRRGCHQTDRRPVSASVCALSHDTHLTLDTQFALLTQQLPPSHSMAHWITRSLGHEVGRHHKRMVTSMNGCQDMALWITTSLGQCITGSLDN